MSQDFSIPRIGLAVSQVASCLPDTLGGTLSKGLYRGQSGMQAVVRTITWVVLSSGTRGPFNASLPEPSDIRGCRDRLWDVWMDAA